LKIGREVYLRKVGDVYLFTVKSHLRKVREAMRKLLGRSPSLPSTSETATIPYDKPKSKAQRETV
jgi:hypothetical protein